MNEEEETNCAPCNCDGACKCGGECASSNPASSERASLAEVRAKLKELQDLVRRCDGRVILSAAIEAAYGVEHDVDASDCALAVSGDSPDGVRWIAAFGYYNKSSNCFDGEAKAIGNGVRFIFERENKKIKRDAAGGGLSGCLPPFLKGRTKKLGGVSYN